MKSTNTRNNDEVKKLIATTMATALFASAAFAQVSTDSVQIVGITKSPFGMSFNTEKGDQYVIESTLDFDKWNTVETLDGTGQTVKFVELREIYYPQQYYRVRL
ncbi:MAG TPA: hypothetical protein EYQ05_03545, partial [Gammaproteobacteria bacterium]|nr:hypothetical protein [Gammaproteobacteria bacterium]